MNNLFRAFKDIISWLKTLLKAYRPGQKKMYSMAIVRRYCDANGSFVGELYMLGSFCGVLQYNMIGMSLDTLPFDVKAVTGFNLDTEHDFLAPMSEGCVRVGALDPLDNNAVRGNVGKLAREGVIQLQVQNRFVEHVLQSKSQSKPSGQGDKPC